MSVVEDKLRPPAAATSVARDAAWLAVLAALAAILLWSWGDSTWSMVDRHRYITDFAGQLASVYLLPALGLLLCLRCGGIDLSVWAVMSLGGVTAAVLINAGVTSGVAFAVAIATGAAIGAVHALFCARLNLPVLLVTLAGGIVIACVMGLASSLEAISIDQQVFDGWLPRMPESMRNQGEEALPLLTVRMLLVAGAVVVVLAALMHGEARVRRGRGVSRRWKLALALIASASLSAAGGAYWLLDRASAPVDTRVIGDLRVASAAVLAGALYFSGPSRTLIAVICLPAAMLLSTIWRQQVTGVRWGGYEWQVAVLAVMAITVQFALIGATAKVASARRLYLPAVVMSAGGLLVLACDALWPLQRLESLWTAGLGLWAGGLIALLIARVAQARAARGQNESARGMGS